MRTFDSTGKETLLNRLGAVPNIDSLVEQITSEFNLQDTATLTTEKVFFNTFRLVADGEYFKAEPHQRLTPRRQALAAIGAPVLEWLKPMYPTARPVLMQIATLPAGATLLWHVDCYLYQSQSHKIHIPIRTNPGALYQTQDLYDSDAQHDYHFEVGQAYEINNIMMHRAINKGQAPRSHLIVDMMEEAAIAEWEAQGVDFFFTHHKQNKKLENDATVRALRRQFR